ncbi:MAG: MASE1 domain-containing protein [Deltaproteobacteria bacterium]|nr:MASE1 domain-containing protein [Deltaproteobacteria bacterium]
MGESRRDTLTLVAVAVGFGITTKLGLLAIAPPENVSYFWPASGYLLAVLALLPQRRWAAALAVVFPTGVLLNVFGANRGLVPSLGYALADVLEAFPAAVLLVRFGGSQKPEFTTLRQVFALVLGAVPAGAVLSAGVGAAVATRFGSQPGYLAVFRTWAAAVVISEVVVTPLLVTWARRSRLSKREMAESGLVVAMLGGVAAYVLGTATPWPLIFLPFPIALWAGLRLGPRGAALASFAFAVLAVVLARRGITPFGMASSTALRVQWTQGLIGTLAVSSLALAAAIAEQEVTAAQLRDAESRHRLIVEEAPIGVVLTGRDGTIAQANAAFCNLLGRSPEEVLGHTFAEFTHPNDLAANLEVLHDLVKGSRERATFEKRYLHSNGAVVSTLVHIAAIRDDQGRFSNTITVVEDITQRRLLEEQLLQAQKMEAVGKLAGGVAHDFNNLLTVILSQSELVAQRIPDKLLKDALGDVTDAARRGAGLTRQLLAFARKQVVEPKTLDLNVLIGDMMNLLRRLITENVELRFVPTPDLFSVRVDPSQLEQIVVNLAVNARDAMPRGGTLVIKTANVTVQPGEVAEVRPGEWALLTMTDTGEGMSEETRRHAFDPFFTTKERGRGTGLGLATVHGIVSQSEGHIAVTSKLGEGTTFHLWFPRVVESTAESMRGVAAARTGTATVLVVEDEPAVRRVACDVLRGNGFRVLEAPDAESALAVAESHSGIIDLVVTDVIMPGDSGRTLVDALLVKRPEMRVLYTSGYTDDLIAHHGVLAPGVSFLQKPYAPADLIEKVWRTMESPS